jgi:hypothetical protein
MKHIIPFSEWIVNEASQSNLVYNGGLPQNILVEIGEGPYHKLNQIAAAAYKQMKAAANAAGVNWGITDSYRIYAVQSKIAVTKGLYSKGGLAAYPGTSNHGLGSAVDLIVKKGDPAHTWLVNNAAKFGFTTIPREPWHWEHKESSNQVMKMPNFVVIPKGSWQPGQTVPNLAGASAAPANPSGATQSFNMNLQQVVSWVVENLEGGYYHPDIHGKILASGETMMGIDRLNGKAFSETPAGVKFWSIVDANKQKWIKDAMDLAVKRNPNTPVNRIKPNATRAYLGGENKDVLLSLVAQMILPNYEKWINNYLGDYKKYVVGYAPLETHFVYAVWNGIGWFQWFASLIKSSVDSGVTDRARLFKISIDDRIRTAKPGVSEKAKDIFKVVGTKIKNKFISEYDKASKT